MTAAATVERLGADEQDLVDYLMSVVVTQKKMAESMTTLIYKLRWSNLLFEYLKPKENQKNFILSVFQLALLIILAPIMVIFNAPARIRFNIEQRRLINSLHPDFMTFLAYKRQLCKWR